MTGTVTAILPKNEEYFRNNKDYYPSLEKFRYTEA